MAKKRNDSLRFFNVFYDRAKIKPTIDYILSLKDNMSVIEGVRAQKVRNDLAYRTNVCIFDLILKELTAKESYRRKDVWNGVANDVVLLF